MKFAILSLFLFGAVVLVHSQDQSEPLSTEDTTVAASESTAPAEAEDPSSAAPEESTTEEQESSSPEPEPESTTVRPSKPPHHKPPHHKPPHHGGHPRPPHHHRPRPPMRLSGKPLGLVHFPDVEQEEIDFDNDMIVLL
ncbi:uncharacterized protein LOC135702604 [Ochlerotatus camptorhynchus]|uniref:uncharacterized protein LOC135702604 n=1 Tax=Ochlerotatus camptorhynchus TaxID=644619 RepID=UPI0031DDD2AF